MERTTENHEWESEAVGKLEEVFRSLCTDGSPGYAEAFLLVGIGDPFVGEEEGGEECVVGEIQHGQNDLRAIGDDGVQDQVARETGDGCARIDLAVA